MAIPGNPLESIQELSKIASNGSIENDPMARKEALKLSRNITNCLEDPFGRAVELCFSPMLAMSARVAVDIDLFSHIERSSPTTSARLAERTGAEELLISKFAKR
ncbi:MAG: hypothetical protein Q9227_003663 [Pyrenula ochraceoflavens]